MNDFLTYEFSKKYTDTNIADINTALAFKANAAEVYTKTETDTALAKKENAAEVDYTITKITGCHREEIGKSGYITTDEPITSLEPTPHSKWRCEVISCEPGDVFTVYTKGDSHKLAWVFLDNSNAKLTPSAKPNTDVNDAVITAPEGAVKLIINANVNSAEPYCFRGNLTDILSSLALKANSADMSAALALKADAAEIGENIARLNSGWHDFDIDYGELTVGYVKGTNGNVVNNHSTLKRTGYIDLSNLNINELTFPQFYSGTLAGYAFFNSAQSFISGGVLGEATEGSVITVTIPSSAKYVMISIKKTNAASFYLKGSVNIFDAIGESEENEDPLNIDPNKSLFSIFQHIGVIGDSLSSGYFNAPTNGSVPADTLTRYEYSWIQQLARRLGIEAFNFSKGGLSTRTWFTADDGAYPAMLTDGEHNCEAYFIALCHNDYNNRNEIPIGTESDAESLADTFYGNYSRIIKTIQDYSPCAKIFLITAKDVSTFEAYNAAMRYMTTIYTKNVYVLDMAVYGGGTDVPSWMKTGAHGNAMGYLLYSRWIESLTSWYIMNHPDEFKYVQFINTIREENIPASQNASLT